MDLGNDRMGVYGTPMNVGNDNICVYRKLGLGVDGQSWSHRGDGTHVEDVEDPIKVQPPGGNRPLIILRVENSRDCISFTSLDDAPLDLSHSPAIESLVSE